MALSILKEAELANLKIPSLVTLLLFSVPSIADFTTVSVVLRERCIQLEDQIKITWAEHSNEELEELKNITEKVLEGPDRLERIRKERSKFLEPNGAVRIENVEKVKEFHPKIRQIEIENQQLRQQYYQTLAKSNVRGIDQLLSLWTTLCR